MEPTNELITLEFRIIYSEGSPGNNNSQWIFPNEQLNAPAGNYLLTVSSISILYYTVNYNNNEVFYN